MNKLPTVFWPVLFLLLIFTGCFPSESEESCKAACKAREAKIARYTKGSHLECIVPNTVRGIPICSQFVGEEDVAVLDWRENTIYFRSLKGDTARNKDVVLQTSVDGKPVMFQPTYFLLYGDSILVYSSNLFKGENTKFAHNRLNVFDKDGKWVREVDYRPIIYALDSINVPKLRYILYIDHEAPLELENGILPVSFYVEGGWYPAPLSLTGKISITNPEQFEVSPFQHPCGYFVGQDSGLTSQDPNYYKIQHLLQGDKWIVSFPASPKAFIRFKDGKEKELCTQSRYFDLDIPPRDTSNYSYLRLQERYGRYGKFIYDEKKKRYFRIVFHPFDKQKGQVHYEARPASIMMFDQSLNLLGESEVIFGLDEANLMFDQRGDLLILNAGVTNSDDEDNNIKAKGILLFEKFSFSVP